ncbi:MAG: hypothetical protein ISR43_08280 [Acidimicrobiia bacterium]|nr:hypothetical protein [Actinomycetota bacterium]MBL6924987.1 hypothetical protein [Acidimicrobiia bacterium]MBL6927209.1 hypothetical protein [Acidimicrobiia bacterium]
MRYDLGPCRPATTVGILMAVIARRRLATVLLAVPGALLVHSLAYLWAHPGAITLDVGKSHDYLPVAGPLVGLAGVLVLVWLAVIGVRAAGSDTNPGVLRLATLQVLVFCFQEAIEALVGSASLVELLGEPAILLGLVLQIPVAALLIGLVKAGSVLIGLVLLPGWSETESTPKPRMPALAVVAVRPVVLSVGRRGPPVVV